MDLQAARWARGPRRRCRQEPGRALAGSNGDEHGLRLGHLNLGCGHVGMLEPEVTYCVKAWPAGGQIVHHDQPPRRQETERLLTVELRLPLRAVVEQEVERRVGTEHVVPVTGEHVHVLVLAEELRGR